MTGPPERVLRRLSARRVCPLHVRLPLLLVDDRTGAVLDVDLVDDGSALLELKLPVAVVLLSVPQRNRGGPGRTRPGVGLRPGSRAGRAHHSVLRVPHHVGTHFRPEIPRRTVDVDLRALAAGAVV